MIHAGARERLRRLYEDERICRLATLPDEALVARGAGKVNGATVLWKQPGVAEGLGDLPWHRDCGMGGHAVMCPAVNCSIHLGPANPDAGDLRFLPASWQTSVRFADGDDEHAPRGISIDARPGLPGDWVGALKARTARLMMRTLRSGSCIFSEASSRVGARPSSS